MNMEKRIEILYNLIEENRRLDLAYAIYPIVKDLPEKPIYKNDLRSSFRYQVDFIRNFCLLYLGMWRDDLYDMYPSDCSYDICPFDLFLQRHPVKLTIQAHYTEEELEALDSSYASKSLLTQFN